MNEARRINIYCDADCEALTDVIMDYFTTGDPSDKEDEEQYDKVGLTKCVSVDNVSVDGSDINEGTNCDFVYCTVSRLLYS